MTISALCPRNAQAQGGARSVEANQLGVRVRERQAAVGYVLRRAAAMMAHLVPAACPTAGAAAVSVPQQPAAEAICFGLLQDENRHTAAKCARTNGNSVTGKHLRQLVAQRPVERIKRQYVFHCGDYAVGREALQMPSDIHHLTPTLC
jgi:hypothetical protein